MANLGWAIGPWHLQRIGAAVPGIADSSRQVQLLLEFQMQDNDFCRRVVSWPDVG